MELKPCPWCGMADFKIYLVGKKEYIRHPENGCIIEARTYEVEAWNRRAVPDAGGKVLELLDDDGLAEKVAKDCHDPAHDARYCRTCENRGDAIDQYQQAIKSRLNAPVAEQLKAGKGEG